MDKDKESIPVQPQEMEAVYKNLRTPYKYGMVVTGTEDEGITNVDCQGIFRYADRWYMTYVSHNADSEFGGYRTNLTSSGNLLDWRFEGVIFQNSAAHPQCAAFPALQDTEWGGSYELEPIAGRYLWTTMEGETKGYEGEPMNIGLLSTMDPSDASAYRHEEGLLLTVQDRDVREGERGSVGYEPLCL